MEQCSAWACRPVVALLAVPDSSAFHIELQAPWESRRRAIQLLIEPVAQTPNSLCYQQSRGDGVGQQGHWIMLVSAPSPCGQRSKQHSAPDAKSAIPDAEHLRPIAIRPEETFGRGDDVIDSGTHDTGGDTDQSDVKNLIEITAQLLPSCGGYPYRQHNSQQNA